MLKALITSSQIRAARALLKWTAQELADSSGVAISTIKRLELMPGVPSGQVRILAAIQSALEGAEAQKGESMCLDSNRVSWVQ